MKIVNLERYSFAWAVQCALGELGKKREGFALLTNSCRVRSLFMLSLVVNLARDSFAWAKQCAVGEFGGEKTEKASALLTDSCRVRRLFMLSLVQQ